MTQDEIRPLEIKVAYLRPTLPKACTEQPLVEEPIMSVRLKDVKKYCKKLLGQNHRQNHCRM
jgi:hypothetical protein